MDIALSAPALLTYALALTLAVASPGPAMVAVVVTTIARNVRAGAAIALGVALGDLPLVLLVLYGLAVIAQSLGWLFVLIKFAGAVYLVWLGIRLWSAKPELPDDGATEQGGGTLRHVVLGAAVALGNPKAILFHAGMMPLLLDFTRITPLDTLLVAAVVLAVDLGVGFCYALLAWRGRRFVRSPRQIRIVNRVGGTAMIGSGVLVAARG
jgi:threonine/homoserine/homoserine lactone efflux protein